MKLSVKKLIAREFLILILILVVTIMSGLCIFPYNAFKQSQISSTQKEIFAQTKMSDSLSSLYDKKRNIQETFFAALATEYNLSKSKENSTEMLWKILSESYYADSIPIKYEKEWDIKLVGFLKSRGYDSGKSFQKFVEENLLNKNDSLNKRKSKKINKYISDLQIKSNHLKYEIFDTKKQIKFSLLILIFIFSIAYPLRFLILGIKWSVKTIKQKD